MGLKQTYDDFIDIDIDKKQFFKGSKFYEMTLRCSRPEFVLYPEIFANTKRLSLFLMTQKIRSIAYGFLNKDQIIEEYVQNFDDLVKIKTEIKQMITLKQIKESSLIQNLMNFAYCLFTNGNDKMKENGNENKIDIYKNIDNLNHLKENEKQRLTHLQNFIVSILGEEQPYDELDTWKIMLLFTMLYLKMYGDYSMEELIKCFCTFMKIIETGYTSSVIKTEDSRNSIHMYSSCQLVFFFLNEVFIDYFDMKQTMIRALYITPLDFCDCYDTLDMSSFDFNLECETNDIFKIFNEIIVSFFE